MTPSSAVVIVAGPADALAAEVRDVLTARGVRTRSYTPGALGTVDVSLTQRFCADDVDVAAILWRVSPEMSLADSFQPVDRTFASAETAATWIAALSLDEVRVINRFDGQAWYSGLRSHYWRDRLAGAGVELTPTTVGDESVPADWRWSPYTTGEPCDPPDPVVRRVLACACHEDFALHTFTVIAGEVVPARPPRNVIRTVELLDSWGVALATVDADDHGRVHRVCVLPRFEDRATLQTIAIRLAEELYAHCAAR